MTQHIKLFGELILILHCILAIVIMYANIQWYFVLSLSNLRNLKEIIMKFGLL